MAGYLDMASSSYAFYEDPKRFKKKYLPLEFAKLVSEPLSAFGIDTWDVLALAGVEDRSDSENEDGPDLASAISKEDQGKLNLIRRATPGQLKAIAGMMDGGAIDDAVAAERLDLVAIQSIDLAYGMGISFTDVPIEVDVLHFPKAWIETITSSPPALLTWGRGRGDSMMPTINDHDLVLLDRSQTTIREQDAIWAFTEGDTGSIKRLRLRNDRVTILSDNPSVPPDEVHVAEIRIVGRVIFIGRRT
jgi:hypothetical protein